MADKKMTRKEFLKASGKLAAGIVAGISMLDTKKLNAQSASAYRGEDGSLCAYIWADQYVIDPDDCVAGEEGCSECVDWCPVEAIKIVGYNETQVACVYRPEECVNCDACLGNCPTGAIHEIYP